MMGEGKWEEADGRKDEKEKLKDVEQEKTKGIGKRHKDNGGYEGT